MSFRTGRDYGTRNVLTAVPVVDDQHDGHLQQTFSYSPRFLQPGRYYQLQDGAAAPGLPHVKTADATSAAAEEETM